jgi:hypothetical protein
MGPIRPFVALCAAFAAGCGDESGAPVDAPPDSPADADPNANRGLGMPCRDESSCLSSNAPACVSVDADAQDDGFCTLECGVVETHGTIVRDDAICREAYMGTVGAAACLLTDGDPQGRYYCAVLCGTDPETPTEDGPCPVPLRCAISIDGDAASELCSD